jgi:hypothetical protein
MCRRVSPEGQKQVLADGLPISGCPFRPWSAASASRKKHLSQKLSSDEDSKGINKTMSSIMRSRRGFKDVGFKEGNSPLAFFIRGRLVSDPHFVKRTVSFIRILAKRAGSFCLIGYKRDGSFDFLAQAWKWRWTTSSSNKVVPIKVKADSTGFILRAKSIDCLVKHANPMSQSS